MAEEKKLCGAKNRGPKGGTCKRPAGWGTSHFGWGFCKLHLGSTRQLVRQAHNQMAAAAVQIYGLPIVTTAHQALEDELHRTAGHVAWLEMKVAGTEHDDDLWNEVGGGQQAAPSIQPAIWVRLLMDERRHLRDVAKTCHDVGIDERRVLLAEQQGQLLAQAVQGMLRELGVENDPRTPNVVRKYLMAAQSGTILEGTFEEDEVATS